MVAWAQAGFRSLGLPCQKERCTLHTLHGQKPSPFLLKARMSVCHSAGLLCDVEHHAFVSSGYVGPTCIHLEVIAAAASTGCRI